MKVGFTTTFPMEVVYAAGHVPVDLNNIFITSDFANAVDIAEQEGLPRNVCSWIKGLYAITKAEKPDIFLGVVQGDCSNTHSLMSLIKRAEIEILAFSYPYGSDYHFLDKEIAKLEAYFGVTRKQVEEIKKNFDHIRRKLVELDELTWKENKVTGFENHLWQISASDFNGNPEKFAKELDNFLLQVKEREPLNVRFRFGYIGVPPIITDLYEYLLKIGVNIVFNEVQRQFAMPCLKENIVEQYLAFTYPYSVYERMEDICREIDKRKLDGIINYVQSFCHRQIDSLLIKENITLPFLTIEGDKPGALGGRTKLRLESFRDMLVYR